MGHEVIAIGPGEIEDWKKKFDVIGVRYKQVAISRTGMNPIADYQSYRTLITLLRETQPDKVFTYMSKTVVLSSFAAAKVGIEEVYALIGGLGSIIRGTGIKNILLKRGLKALYRKALKHCKVVIFHNDDDLEVLVNEGVVARLKTKVVNGSGVNLEKFTPQSFPEQLTFLFAGRLIKDKGIREYLKACKMVKEEHPEVRCLVAGRYDTNPSGIDDRRVKKFIDEGIIEYYEEQADIRPLITLCSIVVLPSYHEGRPKILLEALAMGRPIIATDVPGCREPVEDGKNGYLVKVFDSEDLASKMKLFVKNPGMLNQMGQRSNKIARSQYDVKLINNEILKTMDILIPHASRPTPHTNLESIIHNS